MPSQGSLEAGRKSDLAGKAHRCRCLYRCSDRATSQGMQVVARNQKKQNEELLPGASRRNLALWSPSLGDPLKTRGFQNSSALPSAVTDTNVPELRTQRFTRGWLFTQRRGLGGSVSLRSLPRPARALSASPWPGPCSCSVGGMLTASQTRDAVAMSQPLLSQNICGKGQKEDSGEEGRQTCQCWAPPLL